MLEWNMKTAIKCIDGKWYAFAYDDNGNVYSLGRDSPKEGGHWFARRTDAGIVYVANCSPTRKAAYQKARRNGVYVGEW